MTTNYLLTITHQKRSEYVISYRSGRFYRLERKKGFLPQEKHDRLMLLVPSSEDQIQSYSKKYPNVRYAIIEKSVSNTLFKQFISIYFKFYKEQAGIIPRISVIEGQALKSIIQHFKKVSPTAEQAVKAWEDILNNWKDLEAFYQKQIELKQINSNLNIIIRQTNSVEKDQDKYQSLIKNQ